jgi:cytochrome c oxidase subunit 2
VTAVIPLLLADGSSQNLSIFDPVTPPGESIRTLSVLVLAISGFIFVVVEGILVYAIVRFRRRGTAAGVEPAQVYGSKPIEIAWTAAPALVVFVLTLVSARTLWEVNVPPPQPQTGDNTLFVTVVGRQWWWEYTYDHYNGRALGFTTANELHMPAGSEEAPRPVFLTLLSADVCHSFWVPRFGGKTDCIPGRINSMWFRTEQPGLYVGQCAEYCGTQHANMLIRVIVDSPADFERWLANEQKPAVEAPAARDGRATFLGQSCVNCHRVRGTPAQAGYAPDLTHLMARKTLASCMVENNAQNLRRWVADPQETKPGCLMPAFGLSEPEQDDIVRYLLTLR